MMIFLIALFGTLIPFHLFFRQPHEPPSSRKTRWKRLGVVFAAYCARTRKTCRKEVRVAKKRQPPNVRQHAYTFVLLKVGNHQVITVLTVFIWNALVLKF